MFINVDIEPTYHCIRCGLRLKEQNEKHTCINGGWTYTKQQKVKRKYHNQYFNI